MLFLYVKFLSRSEAVMFILDAYSEVIGLFATVCKLFTARDNTSSPIIILTTGYKDIGDVFRLIEPLALPRKLKLCYGYCYSFYIDSVSIVTRLRAGWSGVRIPLLARDFSLLQNAQTGSRAQPVSSSVGTGVLSRGKAAGGVKSITCI